MSIPYMPLYVADYDADTAHLTVEEDGIYLRLLRLCWRTPGCSIPNDPNWIARRLRVDLATYHSTASPIISEFFKEEKGRVFSPRLMAEYERINATHKKRVESGKKGGRPAKSLKNKETEQKAGLRRTKAGPKQPEPEPDIEKITAKAVPKKGERLAEDWTPSTADIQFAIGEGLTFEAAHREASKFRDYWTAKTGQAATKRDWVATWRNWIRNSSDRSKPKDRQHHNQGIIEALARIAGDANQ